MIFGMWMHVHKENPYIIWKHPLLKQQHKFCRKPFNEHSYHARFQFAKRFQRRRLKSKSVQTTDAKGEQYVTQQGVSILYMDFNYVSPSNEGRYILF
jgi:hypothetical protein